MPSPHPRPRDPRRRLGLVILLCGFVAACSGSAGATGLDPASATAPPAAPSASIASSGVAPEVAPSTRPTPATSTPDATPPPSVMGLEDWTAAQLYLLAGAQPAIRPTCGKAPKLPDGAHDGIQCHPPGIGSIGYYVFDARDVMRRLYFERLAEYGVERDSGEGCFDGLPGEGVDTPGNEGFELRVGCYVDEAGLANARMLFPGADGQSVYVGVVGNDRAIGRLFFDALFPDWEPGMTGCGWCAGQIWSTPGESHE